MALKRGPAGLFEEETLMDRVQRLGTTAPVSPFGATALGATPDQAKMAGSAAQKKSVIEEKVAKEQTLEGQQRLEKPTETPQTQQPTAAQLQQLSGSLSARVQGLVEDQFKQAAQAETAQAGGVNTEALKTILGPGAEASPVYAEANTILQNIQATADPVQREQQLQQLYTLSTGIDPETGDPIRPFLDQDITQLMDLGGVQTSKAAVKNIIDNVTLNNFTPEMLGVQNFDELATTLGVDVEDIPGMTLTDIQKIVAQKQQDTFNQINTIQAKLAAEPPGSVRRQILERQLRSLSESGVRGTEQKVAEVAEDIQTADVVKIGDAEVKVGELLQDDTLSSAITSFLEASPEERDKIFPPEQFKEFRAWLDNNQLALAEVTGSQKASQNAFNQLQQSYQDMGIFTDPTTGQEVKLNKEIMNTFFPGWKEGNIVTTAEKASLEDAFNATGLGTLKSEGYDKYSDVLRTLNLNPEFAVKLKDLDATQVSKAYETGQALSTPGAETLFGVDAATNPFFIPGDTAGEHTQAQIYDLAVKSNPTLGDRTVLETVLDTLPEGIQMKEFRDLILGDMSSGVAATDVDNDGVPDDLKKYFLDADNPQEEFSKFQDTVNFENQVNDMTDDELIEYMFGSGMSYTNITDQYKAIEAAAKIAGIKTNDDSWKSSTVYRLAGGAKDVGSLASALRQELKGFYGDTRLPPTSENKINSKLQSTVNQLAGGHDQRIVDNLDAAKAWMAVKASAGDDIAEQERLFREHIGGWSSEIPEGTFGTITTEQLNKWYNEFSDRWDQGVRYASAVGMHTGTKPSAAAWLEGMGLTLTSDPKTATAQPQKKPKKDSHGQIAGGAGSGKQPHSTVTKGGTKKSATKKLQDRITNPGQEIRNRNEQVKKTVRKWF